MNHPEAGGVLMRGIGRWFVFSRPRAWLGRAVEAPRLLRGISIPGNASCLDIATGLGWASAALLRREASVRIVALDYDSTILPHTRGYLRSQAPASHTALCHGDAKYLPFHNASFDLVLCLYGLHHVRGYLEALHEIARVLKPDGILALIDPVRKSGTPPGGHHGTDVPTIEELQRMLGQSGFQFVTPHISMGAARTIAHKTF
jgi:ubiquinone/menaquinone biosynthesis C-methylase UbiE